jgi:pSer/pThr/pTyr-binding forkhead associated (FHA) protein
MATLCLLDEDGERAEQWNIGGEPVTVGRGASVDLKVEDDGLSRRHFMILREGAEYLIKDLSSRNGTWVHGHRALTARLRHNDCILAGRTLFRFYEDRAVATPAGPPGTGPHGTEVLHATPDPPHAPARTG